MDRSYTYTGGLSLLQDRPYTHDGTCPSPASPNLSHKVCLQGRETFKASFAREEYRSTKVSVVPQPVPGTPSRITVGFREVETTVFDPASVFLSTH